MKTAKEVVVDAALRNAVAAEAVGDVEAAAYWFEVAVACEEA